ncbi:MAG: hypothetical protein J5842_05825 [Lachnospiraceae bacterium]|nr:hypothetical protein [Lachnospiraceae bacterium]
MKEKITVRKTADIIFSILFVLLIFIPFLGLDTTPVIDSKTENRRMQGWEGYSIDGSKNAVCERYIEDRVLFRNDAVKLYGDAIYALTGEFTEDMHMEGKEGELFPADEGYVRSYQHLAVDDRLLSDLTTYLTATDRYLKDKGIVFVFTTGLDKKSVYPEYMPSYLNVDESRKGIMEELAKRLDEANVPYMIPVEEFTKTQRSGTRIYNRAVDVAHWNAEGAFLGMKLLSKKIREEADKRCGSSDTFPVLKRGMYKIGNKERKLDFSVLDITEEVPTFKLKKKFKKGVLQDFDFPGDLIHAEGVYAQHYISDNAVSDKTLLIFGDSFIRERPEYLLPQYRNVYTVGRQNYMYMKTYVETLRPDVVVFEVAERAFVDDLYNYTELADISY